MPAAIRGQNCSRYAGEASRGCAPRSLPSFLGTRAVETGEPVVWRRLPPLSGHLLGRPERRTVRRKQARAGWTLFTRPSLRGAPEEPEAHRTQTRQGQLRGCRGFGTPATASDLRTGKLPGALIAVIGLLGTPTSVSKDSADERALSLLNLVSAVIANADRLPSHALSFHLEE